MDEVNKASEAVRLALEEKDPATRIAGEIAIVATLLAKLIEVIREGNEK